METETLLAQYQHFMQDAALVRLHRNLPPSAGAGRLPGPAVKRRNALPADWEAARPGPKGLCRPAVSSGDSKIPPDVV